MNLPIKVFHINGTLRYLSVSFLYTSLSITFLGSRHILDVSVHHSFPSYIIHSSLYACTTYIHSLVGIYFGCFFLFDVVNITAMNTVLPAFASTRFLFIWGMSQKGINRSHSSSFYEMPPDCIPQSLHEALTRILNR